MTTENKRLRIQAKRLFLIYSKCLIKPENILKQLMETSYALREQYLIAIEKHKDGDTHLHAFIQLTKKITIYSLQHLDLKQERLASHGQYEAVKFKDGIIEYILKDSTDIDREHQDTY